MFWSTMELQSTKEKQEEKQGYSTKISSSDGQQGPLTNSGGLQAEKSH